MANYTGTLQAIVASEEIRLQIMQILEGKRKRVIFDLDDIRKQHDELAHIILTDPVSLLQHFRNALRFATEGEFNNYPSPKYKLPDGDIPFGFIGSFGRRSCTPRGLSSLFINSMVKIEGIITKVSMPHPKISMTTHYCEATRTVYYREYNDQFSLKGIPTSSVIPISDENGNELSLEFGYSKYIDFQTVTLQEMPERAPPGELSRSIDIILTDDLVDRVKAGDRVHIVGVCKGVSRRTGSSQSQVLPIIVIANCVMQQHSTSFDVLTPIERYAIRKLTKGAQEMRLTSLDYEVEGNNKKQQDDDDDDEDEEEEETRKRKGRKSTKQTPKKSSNKKNKQPSSSSIQQSSIQKGLLGRRELLTLLSRSIAPFIYGQERLKEAVLMMLIGGVEKSVGNLGNTHLRGDINMLLVGDPSTAKSQMLRFVSKIAPVAVMTTGRGSTGVGLTAAVVTDQE
ncbi:MAG: putative DNA replication licensing factor MCM3, partial [Streblomastix strix]